jgi:hypothetical protein
MGGSRNLQGYATIPRSVLHDPDIPSDAKLVYLVLSSHVGDQTADVWPSHATIAKDSGLSVSTVKRQLVYLRDKKLVRWTNHIAPGTDCKTINTYELVATTSAPQQTPIAQPEPTSTQNLGSQGAITDPGRSTQDVGSGRPPKEVLNPSNDEVLLERPELRALCQRLADLIVANGSKRPRITKRWLDEARRLIDLDERTIEQIEKAIDWSQEDSFWRTNILSMETLRKQYDKMRLDAIRKEQAKAPRNFLAEREQQVQEKVTARQSDRLSSAR